MSQNFKTIDQPFVIEMIDERFDNISIMLTDNALVYGSSITSIMSGLAADGDLDIAVSHTEFMTLCERFANSSKWKQISGDRIKETDFSNRHREYRSSFEAAPIRFKPPTRLRGGVEAVEAPSSFSKYKKYPTGLEEPCNYRNISKTVTFETVGNRRVQIIQAKEKTHNSLDDAMSIVKAVDFIFCGIAIDKHGKTFEVIKSAFDDCHNKIIRVANYHSRLTERFKKYIKRGWSLGISIDQANQNYLKEKKQENKREKNLPTDDEYIRIEYSKKSGLKLIFLSPMFKKLKPEELHSLITSTSKQIFGIYLKRVTSTHPSVYIENSSIRGSHLSRSIAKQIRKRIIPIVKERLAAKKKKKFQTAGDYGDMIKFAEEHLNTFVDHNVSEGSYIDVDQHITTGSVGQHIAHGIISEEQIKNPSQKEDAVGEVDMPDEAKQSEEVPMSEQSNMFAENSPKYTVDIINKIVHDTPGYGEWKPVEKTHKEQTAGAEWYSGLKKEKEVKEDVVDTINKIIDDIPNN